MRPRLLLPALMTATVLAFPAGAGGAPGWRPPLAVESAPSATALSFPKIAARPGGCTTVAFERGSTVFASTRPPGGSFAPIQTLGAIAPTENPELAVGGGVVAATWEDNASKVRLATATGCDPLGATAEVPGSYGFTEDPVVAVDSAGTAVALFQAGGSGERKIYRSELPPGGTPSEPTPFAVPGGTEGFRAKAAANEVGGVAMVFDVVQSGSQVYGARRSSAGAWSTPVRLNEEGKPAVANSARVAISPDGSLFAVWVDAGGKKAILATLDPGGTVTRTTLIESGGTLRDPAIAVDAAGRLAIAWAEEVAVGQARIHGKHREPGGSLSSQKNISAPTNIGRGAPWLAIDADGRTIVAWTQQALSPMAAQIGMASTRAPGSEFFSGEQPISETDEITLPTGIDADADGNTLVSLYAIETPREAKVAAFDAAGPLLSGLSVPSGQAGASLPFSLSALDAWSAPTTTHWEFGDGSSADGDSVTHAYATAGSFGVTATAADSLGNTAQASGTAAIAPVPLLPPGGGGPPSPGVPPDTTPPRIAGLKVRPAQVQADSRARVGFKLSEPARLRFALKPRGGSFQRAVKTAGRVSIAVPRRLLRALAPGGYRLRLLATDTAGNRSTATARFKVLPDRPL